MFRTVSATSVVCVVLGSVSSVVQAASVYDDGFTDGARGPQWSSVIDDPARLTLAEQGGRLDVLGLPGGTSNDDALYLSTFRLSTAADFDVRVDYSFASYAAAGPSGTAMGLVFGVGRDLDGTDSAAIGQGWGTTSPIGFPITLSAATVGYRTDDVPAGGSPTLSAEVTGTFEISYDSAGDDLTLRRVGSGISLTINDTVRQVWQANDLYVSLGARGDGFATTAGQAYLDNFTVVSGTTVPEPLGLAGIGLAGALLGRRRRSGRGR